MNVREASVKLHVSTGTVYLLIEAGILPAHRLGPKGRKIYLDESDVDRYWASTKKIGKQATVNRSGLKYLTLPGE
jgi:excisionase family DNA binding protein